MASFTAANALKERMARSVLKMKGVHGIGVGYRDPRRPGKGAAVVIYADALAVSKPAFASSMSALRKGQPVRVPVRVVRTKGIRSHADFRRRIRPVPAGYSIGTAGGSGTAGLIVTQAPAGSQRYFFSNNHVLTNPVNSPTPAETLQPGGADNGRPGIDRVGRLSRFVRLSRTRTNLIDAAISLPVRNGIASPRYATVGVLPGHVATYRVGERFKKVGRTTGLVFGRVDSVNTDVRVDYGPQLGVLAFRNQSVIRGSRPVSLPGDSGSVWLRRADNFAAAVNFAGSADGRMSVSFPVDWALRRFGVRIARPDGAGRVKRPASARGGGLRTRTLTRRELAGIPVVRPGNAGRSK